jgi:hypothetical protein
MKTVRFRWWGGVIGVLASTTAVSGFVLATWPGAAPATARPGKALLADLPECPVAWDSVPIVDSNRVYRIGEFAVPGPITDVPEFHDCQKFILVQNDTASYGPLVAIFASFRLDSLMDSLQAQPLARTARRPQRGPQRPPGALPRPGVQPRPERADAMGGATPGPRAFRRAASAALIFNYGTEYRPLGIKPAFSCLYMFLDDRDSLHAMVTSIGEQEKDCLLTIDPTSTEGTWLQVRRTRFAGLGARDIPPVARWDWDPMRSEQYIGIKCGDAWCEIGREGFSPSPYYLEPAAGPAEMARVVTIKGWYDEQRLAVISGGVAVPSNVVGTIFPHPKLGTYSDIESFTGRWVLVAFVKLSAASDQYRLKHNFDGTPAGTSMNRMYACYGTKESCEVDADDLSCPLPPTDIHIDKAGTDGSTWWLKVIAPGGRVTYKCLIRRGHEELGHQIPGTTRWRWVANDETTWNRCIYGCCEADQ